MERLIELTSEISGLMWGWPMIILLLGTHIFLTVRLKFPQRKIFTGIRLSITRDDESKGDVSQFAALATSLAATIGTGNIIGVATAVALGGPGSVLWCWITGVFGIATKYAEGLLAVKYRVTASNGKMSGGPMYALEKGLNMKWLAVLFALFTSIAAFGIGNTVQANAIASNMAPVLTQYLGMSESGALTCIGIVCTAAVGLVILGGVKSISRICTALVPLMALCYVLGCIYILCVNHEYIPEAIHLIFREAFSTKASLGGAAGSAIMLSARYGIARGLFSNESGMGSAPIAAAAAKTKNPVRQALVSSTGTFWDTVVICAITGLVLTTYITSHKDQFIVNEMFAINQENGSLLTMQAFSTIPYIGMPVLTFGIITFAYSTILGWSYYGEKALEYLAGPKTRIYYRVVYMLFVFTGCVMGLDLVWNIADIMNALMAVPNLIALLLLSSVVALETNKYLWSGNLDKEIKDNETESIAE